MSNPSTGAVRTLRDLIESGETALGASCTLPGAHPAEVMSRLGFDWLFLDMQHGLGDRDEMAGALRALDVAGIPALARAAWNRPELVGWLLDAGAQGVVAPMINNAEDARALVAASRYAPVGYRSWGPTRPSLTQKDFSPAQANKTVVCAVLIETADGVNNLEAICDVEGVDMVVVGQSDLAVSFGLGPGEGPRSAEH